jgi:primary-amine oxidase
MRIKPALALTMMFAATIGAASTDTSHPLDGLTPAEFETVVTVLREAEKIDDTSQFAIVNLAEPAKQDVLAWKQGDDIQRQAFVAIRHDRKMYEGVIDLDKRTVLAWKNVKDVQPQLLDTEWLLSQVIVRTNKDWRAAIAKRGIKNFKTVFCFPVFPGNFDRPLDKDNRRLGVVGCYDTGSKHGLWGRPIEGLIAIVDYDDREVVELVDTGVVPIPAGGPGTNKDQPVAMPASGPATQRFKISGSWIDWDKWRFHLRIDPRVGPVLSQVSINDGEQQRSVLYQASISELFVPYMDPTENWYFRTYLDVGEYGIGASGVPLRPGTDCPADSALIDGHFLSDSGKVQTKNGIICVFERITGDAGWSHFEITQSGSELRRHTELVVRFIVWLGNYDYVLDWVFTETGSIKGRVGATGIVQIKGVNAQTMQDENAAEENAYGRLIAPGLSAINHDHFFNFRLDLDVDGTQNDMLIERLQRTNLDPEKTGTPRRQIWQVASTVAKKESDAKLNVDPARPALWRVASPDNTNYVGNPTSYQLTPGAVTRTLMDNAEIAHRRAAFTDYNLWVTPYRADERYAAGVYPNRHPGGAGLPEWTAKDRSLEGQDIVLWYTIGMHHVVRAEDWPIMPMVQHQFELRPFDFFDYNPTVD